MAKIKVKLQDLHDLYLEQLRDLYSAETQLLKALPKMAASATDPDLKQGFEDHLVQTQEQVGRLEGLFQDLEQDPGGHTCQAMLGLVKEGEEMIREKAAPAVKDAGLIAAAQRIEHYEIAGYGTVAALRVPQLRFQPICKSQRTSARLFQAGKFVRGPATK